MTRLLFAPGRPWRDAAYRKSIARTAQRLRDELEEERFDKLRSTRTYRHRIQSQQHRAGQT